MAFSSGDPIEYGKELADRTKSPWDFAGQNIMDQFKKRRDTDYEIEKLQGMEVFKNKLPPNALQKSQIAENEANTDYIRHKTGSGSKITDALAETQSANDLLNNLEQMSKSIGDIGNPLQAGIKSSYNKYISSGRGSSSLNKKRDEDLGTYNSISPAAGAAIYRALTGDKRLSDDDAKTRALPLLWKPGESEGIKAKKFALLKKAIQQRTERLSNGQFAQVDDPTKGTLHLTEDIYSNALQSLGDGDTNTQQLTNSALFDKEAAKKETYNRLGYGQ